MTRTEGVAGRLARHLAILGVNLPPSTIRLIAEDVLAVADWPVCDTCGHPSPDAGVRLCAECEALEAQAGGDLGHATLRHRGLVRRGLRA